MVRQQEPRRMLCISRKVKKSESKSQRKYMTLCSRQSCVYPVKLKNLKANHNLLVERNGEVIVVYIP